MYSPGPDLDPREYCDLCGDPLPLDRQCSCAGDPDLDPEAPGNQLRRNFVFTYPRGNTRTYRKVAPPRRSPW